MLRDEESIDDTPDQHLMTSDHLTGDSWLAVSKRGIFQALLMAETTELIP
jgi:hypothetical protein